MNRIIVIAITILTSFIILTPWISLPAHAADVQTMEYRFHWAPSPVVDKENQALSIATSYEVWLKKDNEGEERVSFGQRDTTYTLNAEPGVLHRLRVRGVDSGGRLGEFSEWSDPLYFEEVRSSAAPPAVATMRANYPNPFNPETRIVYGVPSGINDGDVARLDIFSLAGRHVRSFEVERSPGWHEAVWNGTDDRGQVQSTGMYVTRLTIGTMVTTNKMTMVK